MDENRSILIVDDNIRFARTLSFILKRKGYTVTIAASVKEAISQIKEMPYDAILLDMKMSHMDGQHLFQYLEEEHPQLAKKVIFVTGDVMRNKSRDFIAASGQPSLFKPFSPDKLVKVLESILADV
jgi:CheY-like chemotaxis protein